MRNLRLLTATALLVTACGTEERREQTPAAAATEPAAEATRAAADVVYRNGRIYTVNDAQPWAEAVAIKAGRFVEVGSNDDVRSLIAGDTKVVDLGGRFAVPGLFDVHSHPGVAAFLYMEGQHESIVNSKALEIAGLNKDTPDPPGGRLGRDNESGELNGVLYEDLDSARLFLQVQPSGSLRLETTGGVEVETAGVRIQATAVLVIMLLPLLIRERDGERLHQGGSAQRVHPLRMDRELEQQLLALGYAD